MKKKVFVIIVTYNGIKWLPDTLESVRNYPVIVVDNGSTDDSKKYIKSEHPEMILLEQKENLGFGKANNIGVKIALENNAEAVFLLNQDAKIDPGSIDVLMNCSINNPDYGIISPLHLNHDGNSLEPIFLQYLNKKKELLTDFLLQKPLKELYDYNMINAAAWLIPKITLMKVGGFHPMFFLYGEDDNYCQRVLYHNFKIGVCPVAKIYHDSGFDYHSEKEIGSEEYYNRFLNQVKVKYGNVNLPDENSFMKFKRSLLKKSILTLLRLDLDKSQQFWSKWRMINDLNFEDIKMECRKENSSFLFNS
jgi:GT2 family glycosyltransferase